MITPSSPSFAFIPALASTDEARNTRIQRVLEKSRELAPISSHINTPERLAIIKQTMENVSPSYARVQAKMTTTAHRDVSQLAIVSGRLFSSAIKEKNALAKISEQLERSSAQSRLLSDSAMENIRLVRQELVELDVLQERLDSLEKKTFQDEADFKKLINQELLFQQAIQQKIENLEEQSVKIKNEIDLLQKEIVYLKEGSNGSSASLLEVQQQEALLKKGLAEVECAIKDYKSKHACYRRILIAATVAGIAACTILFPPLGVVGVSAGSEISVGLVFTGPQSVSFTFASGAAAAVGMGVLASEKNSDTPSLRRHNPVHLPSERRYQIDKEDFLEMAAVGSVIPTVVNGLDVVIEKAIDLVCTSSPYATQQCRNIEKFYQESKDAVTKSVTQSVAESMQLITDFSKTTMTAFCNSSLERYYQCLQIESVYTDVKEELNRAVIYPVKNYLESRPTLIEELALDNEKRLGIPPPITKQFFRDGEQTLATIGLAVLGKTILPSNKPTIVVLPSRTYPERRKLPSTLFTFERIPVNEEYYLNRRIRKRTKMVPEDIGISALEFEESMPPVFGYFYDLRGSMIRKKNVFLIQIENIVIPEGRLNGFTVMSNFKKIAKANNASILQIEAECDNMKLFGVMKKRYGEPEVILRKSFGTVKTYHKFTLPVED